MSVADDLDSRHEHLKPHACEVEGGALRSDTPDGLHFQAKAGRLVVLVAARGKEANREFLRLVAIGVDCHLPTSAMEQRRLRLCHGLIGGGVRRVNRGRNRNRAGARIALVRTAGHAAPLEAKARGGEARFVGGIVTVEASGPLRFAGPTLPRAPSALS